ncbi:MAG: MBL fold metallo-hydrolase [Longimicrobiales bacterium]|nr:MBL fold metallo-hydrolase [Longimicrobiales bacterium]
MPVDPRRESEGEIPRHHDPDGGFRNPWPTFGERASGLRWALQRITGKLPSDPTPEEIPRARPAMGNGSGQADGDSKEVRATWIGHATFLLQIGGLNLLTDPHWSDRASPVSWAGPRRLAPPGVPFEELPRVDAVLLSHDHFDHLDQDTIRALAERFGQEVEWCAPTGYAPMLRKWGARRISELDWYESKILSRGSGHGDGSGDGIGDGSGDGIGAASVENGDRYAGGDSGSPTVEATFLPAQHWSARSPFSRNRRLWGSWAVRAGDRSVYFGGDTGWFPEYPEIGRHSGPFDLVILPIGAYAPRWFMKPVHMNPTEAVRSYQDLGSRGVFAGMHWGTFRLSDEHPLEPPVLTRRAWKEAGLPEERLWLPAIGETRRIP